MPLLVLGAGIDGLATALCLAHQGFPVQVLDHGADPGSPDDRSGDGVTVLRPGATRVLHGLGVLEELLPHAVEPRAFEQLDAVSGQVLRRVDLGDEARARYGSPCLAVGLRELRRALARACGTDEMVDVRYESRPSAIEDLGDAALVTLTDGDTWRAEALVAADGSRSQVRSLLERGTVALSPPFALRRSIVAATPADGSDQAEPPTMRVWSCPHLLISRVPAPGGGVDVTLVARADLPAAEREWVVSRLDPELRRQVSAVVAREPERVVAHQRPLPRWTRHRLTVLGGAAQPLLPHTGGEETETLRDAHALGAAFDRSDGRILPGLEGYESARAPGRTSAAAHAAEYAAMCHAEGLTRTLRDRLWTGATCDDVAQVLGEPRPAGPHSSP